MSKLNGVHHNLPAKCKPRRRKESVGLESYNPDQEVLGSTITPASDVKKN